MSKRFVDVPLFDTPEVKPMQLSTMYDTSVFRARPGFDPSWTRITAKTRVNCDECFARQHETQGASGPRAAAKARRSFRGGSRLDLCREHEGLWRARDEADTTGESTTNARRARPSSSSS